MKSKTLETNLGKRRLQQGWVFALALLLAACGSAPKAPIVTPAGPAVPSGPATATPSRSSAPLPALPAAGSGRGGYYQDDGPGEHPPEGLMETPDPVPQVEPLSASGNKPYKVFGKTYTPITDEREFKQRGIGSWYGKKFHGQKTSSGELYDMYKLSAAHPILPIPSYARVTNLSSGAQIIVRINDRGPFHSNRIIDLSYTAALKLGILGKGSSELEVERLLPDEIARIAAARKVQGTVPPVVAANTAPVVKAALPAEESLTLAVPFDPPTHAEPLAPAGGNEETAVAAAFASDAPAPAALPASLASGFYVQLGAFGDVDHAEVARSRWMRTWDASLPPLEITHIGAFYRVHSGPYASRDEAAAAARKVQVAGVVKPLVVQH